MRGKEKGALILSQLSRGTLFKVEQAHSDLTLDGVYQIDTAKADHGRSVKIYDLSRLRRINNTFVYENVITVPTEKAKEISVYKLPLLSHANR